MRMSLREATISAAVLRPARLMAFTRARITFVGSISGGVDGGGRGGCDGGVGGDGISGGVDGVGISGGVDGDGDGVCCAWSIRGTIDSDKHAIMLMTIDNM